MPSSRVVIIGIDWTRRVNRVNEVTGREGRESIKTTVCRRTVQYGPDADDRRDADRYNEV
jgi:hypothetical protein